MPLNALIPLQTQGIDPRTSLGIFQAVRQTRQDDEDRRQQQIDRNLRRADDAENRTERQKTRAKETGVEDALRSATGEDGSVDWGKAAAAVRNVSPIQAAAWWQQADQKKLLDAKKRIDTQAQLAGGLLNADDAGMQTEYTRQRQQLIASGMATEDQIPDASTFQTPTQMRAFLQTQLSRAMEPKELYDTLEKKILEATKAGDKTPERARFTATDGKSKFEVTYDKTNDKYFRGGKDVTADVASGAINEWTKPGERAPVYHEVTTENPDGSTSTTLQPVTAGMTVKTTKPKGTTISDKDRGAAEQWKTQQLRALEVSYNKGELDDDHMQAAKLNVQNTYLAKLGQEPVAVLDASWEKKPAGPATQRAAVPPMGPSDASAATPPANTQPPTNAPETPTSNSANPAQNTNRGKTFSVTVAGRVYSFPTQAALDEFKHRAGLSGGGSAPMPRNVR